VSKHTQKLIVDFDGVLHWYRKGWHDGTIYDEPVPGSQDAMRKFLEAGYEVIVFSTRAFDRVPYGDKFEPSQFDDMMVWFAQHGFPVGMKVWQGAGKPIGTAYIDDRAVAFKGHWNRCWLDVEQLRVEGTWQMGGTR